MIYLKVPLKHLIFILLLIFSEVSAEHEKASANLLTKTQIRVMPARSVRLDVAYDFVRGVTEYEAFEKFPKAEAVLTGNFFGGNFSLASLLIIDGRFYHAGSGIKNRPTIAQEWLDFGGNIVFVTENYARENRNRYRIAVEGGPFLILDGKDYNDWNFADPSFFRWTNRCGVGLTEDGQFFWARGSGTLEVFRDNVRAQLGEQKIKTFMNLDGGSSADPTSKLPTRLVIMPR